MSGNPVLLEWYYLMYMNLNIVDRNKTIGDVKEIRSWLGFTFPGRAGKYSDMGWHWYHFNGTDRVTSLKPIRTDRKDEYTKKKAIFRILGRGKDWARDVDTENGNYDYLMYANIDHCHPQVLQPRDDSV
jgi:alpha-amylase